MPFQNRVTPFGAIIADPARGTVMGNRGCLRDHGENLLHPYQVTRWIICKIEFKGRRRPPMPPDEYTSLFFLDEATALAAGHRPCYECNRPKYHAFRDHWMAANPTRIVAERQLGDQRLDEQLHRERITQAYFLRDCRKRVYLDMIDALPDGVFVALGPELVPHLVLGQQLRAWSTQGYGPPTKRLTGLNVVVLTPSSTVRALAHGYISELHPSVEQRA